MPVYILGKKNEGFVLFLSSLVDCLPVLEGNHYCHHFSMADKRSSSTSSSPNVSPLMIVPKREPIENDVLTTNKRRLSDYPILDIDSNVANKRQMATKKHQHSDSNLTKLTNGRNGNLDEQQKLPSSISPGKPR